MTSTPPRSACGAGAQRRFEAAFGTETAALVRATLDGISAEAFVERFKDPAPA